MKMDKIENEIALTKKKTELEQAKKPYVAAKHETTMAELAAKKDETVAEIQIKNAKAAEIMKGKLNLKATESAFARSEEFKDLKQKYKLLAEKVKNANNLVEERKLNKQLLELDLEYAQIEEKYLEQQGRNSVSKKAGKTAKNDETDEKHLQSKVRQSADKETLWGSASRKIKNFLGGLTGKSQADIEGAKNEAEYYKIQAEMQEFKLAVAQGENKKAVFDKGTELIKKIKASHLSDAQKQELINLVLGKTKENNV